MALYAIGDLHLSLGADKPMDVFGGNWDNYVQKIKVGFASLGDMDTCVICGDLTWSMTLEESLTDFRFIDSLPGKKIILKGNHDYWWSTVTKAKEFFARHDIATIDVLNNNSFLTDGVAVCGTRGWFLDEESGRGREHDRKIMAREIGRLEASLSSAGESADKICFLHYPPIFRNYICREIIDVMIKYGVKSCWYGHIHGIGHRYAVTGLVDGIDYHMISADYVGFSPVKVR
jgi:predicted phosphohydrolase